MHEDFHRRKAALDYLRAEEAASWVQILLDPTPEQRARFIVWLKSVPQNVEDFLFMLSLDDALESIDRHRAQDIAALMAQVDPHVVPFPSRPSPPYIPPSDPRRALQYRPWRAAGVVCLAALVIGGGLFAVTKGSGSSELRTGIGEQRSFELKDGSIVQLNARSYATVHFSGIARQIWLHEGEALFRVRHERERPFQVITDAATVEDQGTQFDVYARPESTRVAVLEGSVTVRPNGRAPTGHLAVQLLSLEADQEANVDHTGSMIRSKNPVADAVAWRQRRLVFRQESLARIAEEFNRYNRRQLVVEGAGMSSRLYTGVFDADDPDSLADVLARDSGVDVQKTADKLTVRAR